MLFNGRPLAIPEIAEHATAILEAWHPGVEAGNAILDILFGEANPSGKLTTSFPYTAGQCPVYYNHINTGRPAGKFKCTSKYLDVPAEPLYPFGYGLSYTTFVYRGMEAVQEKEGIHASIMVKNTGERAGDEIVQCYIHDLVGRRVRPVQKLVDFQIVSLEADEERRVSFLIPFEKLRYYDDNTEFVVEGGTVDVMVGKSSRDYNSVRLEIVI